MSAQESYSVRSLAGSLATAFAVPAMALAPQAMAQGSNAAPLLSPVQVQGEGISSYEAPEADSPKFTAPLLDTPKSVQVIPQAVIQDTAATSLQDVLRNSPGITFGAGEGGNAGGDIPIIRGQNSAGSIFIDGVRDPGMRVRDTYNIEQVEIIKGPDSVYAGRGGAGGSINLVTKRPKAEDAIEATAQIGTDSNYRGTVDGNWLLSGTVGFRLNVMGAKGDVPGRDDAVDFSRWGVAPTLTLGLGTPTRITLGFEHYQDDSMPDYSIPYDPESGQPVTETRGVSRKTFYGLEDRDFQDQRDDTVFVDFQHDMSSALKLRNVTRYSRSLLDYAVTNPDDSRGNVVNGWVYRSLKARYDVTKTFSNTTDLSGKFNTGSLEHAFDVGLEYSNIQRTYDGYNEVPAPAGSTCTALSAWCTPLWDADPGTPYPGRLERRGQPTRYNTDTLGVYAFDTIKFTEQWQGSFGVRMDKYDTRSRTYDGVSADRQDTLFNYQLGLAYKPLPNGTLYATFGTSSTPSALSTAGDAVSGTPGRGGSPATKDLAPEKSRSIELGTKWQLLDDNLTLTAAVFQDIRKNTSVAVSATEYEQVGESKVRGFELGFSGNITPRWNVYGGYTFMDSELVEGAYNSGAVGEDLPNTPRNAFSLWSTYKVLPQLTVGGGAYYVDKVFGNADSTYNDNGTPKARWVPSYWRFDAMAAYTFNKHLAAQLNVVNLFDKTYYTKAYGSHYAALGTGRAAMLTLKVSY
ncbi:TonB-dependent receptor [Bordetella sp. 2513F-2]